MIARKSQPQGKQYADFHLDCKDWEKNEADEGSTSGMQDLPLSF